MSQVRTRMIDADYRWLAGYCAGRFEVEVSPKRLHDVCEPHFWTRKGRDNFPYPELCDCWLKNRLCDLGLFSHGGQMTKVGCWFDLHFFFIGLEETEEMLARLPENEPRAKRARPVRSRLSRTIEIIHPIDALAAKVVPEKPFEDNS